MKKGWKVEKLGDVCEIFNGGTPDTKVPKYWGGSILWITPKDMGKLESIYVDDTARKITHEGLKNSSARILPPNSVILSSRAPIGHLAINTKEMTTNQGCKGIVPKKELSTLFLYYFLENSVELLNSLGSGTTFKELSASKLAEVPIPIPPLPEQQRIVSLLDETFAGLAQVHANAERNLVNAREVFEAVLQEIFERPHTGWKDMNLDEVVEDMHQGLNTAGYKIQFYDSGYPIIQSRNIERGVIDLDEKIKYMSEEDWNLYKDKYRPNIGDVFFSNIGTIGKTAVVTEDLDYLFHWNIYTFKTNKKIVDSFYLKYFLDHATNVGYFAGQQKGGTVSFVTKKMIARTKIKVPPLEEQRAIVKRLDALAAETSRLEAVYQSKLEAVEELRKSVLAKAFEGEL